MLDKKPGTHASCAYVSFARYFAGSIVPLGTTKNQTIVSDSKIHVATLDVVEGGKLAILWCKCNRGITMMISRVV